MSDAFVYFRDLSPAGWQAWLSRRVVGREAPRWEDLGGWERMSISSVSWPYLPDRLHARLAHLLYDRPYPPEPAAVRRAPPLRAPDRQAVARRLAALGSADAVAARLGRARPGTPQWERLRRLVADEARPLYRWADAGLLDAVGSDPRLAAWLALRPALDAAFGPELRLAGACLPGGRPPARRATIRTR